MERLYTVTIFKFQALEKKKIYYYH